MDDVSIWLYKKSQQTNVSNLPTNPELRDYIARAQSLKLLGSFENSWDNEDTANRIILDLLFESGRVSDSNKFSLKMDITKETYNLIELEKNYKKASDAIEIYNLSLVSSYNSDVLSYGRASALRKKKKTEDDNKSLIASRNVIIQNYNKAILEVNRVAGADRIIAEEREKERIKQEARKALEDSQAILRNARDSQRIMNTPPPDTPMTIYMRKKQKADTANEINESTESTYIHDLIYLFFKIFLFVILGLVFYYLMKDQNPKEMIDQVKETTKVMSEKVTEGVKTLKENIQEKGNELRKGSIKGSINGSIKGNEIIKS